MSEPAGLARLNGMGADAAMAALLSCCGSTAWAWALSVHRPFASAADLFATAERLWWDLAPEDWHQAFAAHPRIGERASGPLAQWSEAEQAGPRDPGASL